MSEVWVFSGARSTPSTNASLPGGVFSSIDTAEDWIKHHNLSGTLRLYRVDVRAYDWAVANGHFKPSKPHRQTSEFIGQFAGGVLHYHCESGVRADNRALGPA